MENSKIVPYKELVFWQQGKKIAVDIYALTSRFPDAQNSIMTAQMQRTAIAIPSAIAQGRGRDEVKEFAHFLSIARGLKSELETQLIISAEAGLCKEADIEPVLKDLDILGRMLNKMILSLKPKSYKPKANNEKLH